VKRFALLGAGLTVSVTAALVGPAATPASAAAHPHKATITVVARGLANPRGITMNAGGVLLVAEAGKGGSGPCVPGPEGGTICFGLTSALTAISAAGVAHRIVTGLPSLADPNGAEAVGLDNTTFGAGGIIGVIGMGLSPKTRATFGAKGRLLATMVQLPGSGRPREIADLAAYEQAHNPDHGDPGSSKDTDPYDVVANGGNFLVADAGGNDILNVTPNGHVSTRAVLHARLVLAPPSLGLPPGTKIPMQAVPTSIALRSGSAYVGQLTGFPFPVGAARVYRLQGSNPVIFRSGFTNIIDIAYDRSGNLYVLEIAKNGLLSGSNVGALIKVAPNGTRTEIAKGQLKTPGGMAIAPNGSIYVSVNATSPTKGEVVRVTP
jgi:hypothetical protein